MSKEFSPSLASYFAAPRGFKGEFGLVTGYSADADFFNVALEKFTLNMKGQRAYQGDVSLVLMLDPKHAQISPIECPGLLHLSFRHNAVKSFNLLHSKVALLNFKAIDTDEHLIRLIVSTGNWTRQTLEDSLDLIWSIDVHFNNQDAQFNADIAAGYRFLSDVLTHFDTAILCNSGSKKLITNTNKKYALFNKLLDEVKVEDHVKPRFFDNRYASLLDQLPALVKHHCNDKKRNYLTLGSGFYEGGSSTEVPRVISLILERLNAESLITKNAEKSIVVNQQACQSIALSLPSLLKSNWRVLRAYDPFYKTGQSQRSLHGKFIFSANKSESEDACKRAWVYLGSGNLTGPGFNQKASKFGGNLEAGVVFKPHGITWFGEENPETAMSLKLPICSDDDYLLDETAQLNAGSEMPEHEHDYISFPINYFVIEELETGKYALIPNAPFNDTFSIVSSGAIELSIQSEERLLWVGKPPRQLTVSWLHDGISHTQDIPVIDEYGRISATELPELAMDDAWYIFTSFPQLPSSDPEIGDGDEALEDGLNMSTKADISVDKSYSINSMMALIELVAETQTQVPENDWLQWCNRLEMTFSQLKNNSAFSFFKEIAINPISPLWHRPFRPDYAESAATDSGDFYEKALKRIEQKLGVETLARLGQQ